MQANILDRGPNDSEATGLCREYIDLIGALPHVTEQTVDGIGGSECADASPEETHRTLMRCAVHSDCSV